MKRTILILTLLTSVISVAANQLKVKNFNHSDILNLEGNIEEYKLEDLNLKAFIIPLKNSDDFLIAYGKNRNVELTPIIFFNTQEKGSIIYKDVNNRKVTLICKLLDGKLNNVIYIKENDSNEGFALNSEKNCIGGSTSQCISITWQACREDPGCSFTCAVAGPSCPLAIAAACAVHCGKADEITPE